MFDFESFYTYLIVPSLTAITCYIWRDIIWNHIFHTPGVGKLSNKRDRKNKSNTLRVETEIGSLNLPTFCLSNAAEVEIYFFDFPVVDKPELLRKGEFNEKYSMYGYKPLQKSGRHFILPFIHTDSTKDKKVSVMISSLTEMDVYVFTIENDFIDLSKHYADFLVRLETLDDDLLELSPEPDSIAPIVNQEEPATPPDSSS